jgi:integrase/recombinase XerC
MWRFRLYRFVSRVDGAHCASRIGRKRSRVYHSRVRLFGFGWAFVAASPERDRVILELLYGSGLRAAELVGINVDDFRDEDVLVVRGKGLKERFVIIGEYAQVAIKAWLPIRSGLLAKFKLETPALLFSVGPKHTAERLDVRSVGRVVKAIAEAKGLDPAKWHPHLLRHACGTHMHDHDAPLQGVATFLGHARLSTAQIYTRVSVGRMMQTYRSSHPHAKG